MAVATKWAAGVVAVGVAAWCWWPATAVPTVTAGTQAVVVVHAESMPLEERVQQAPAVQREIAGTGSAAAATGPAQPMAIVRGRCVDARGEPLADCIARLQGHARNQPEMDVWLRDHDEPDWENLEQSTGADGRFEFRFVAPPPFQFSAHIVHLSAVGGSRRWTRIDAGAVLDMGDVVLPPGVRLSGVLVDQSGQPVADALVTASLAQRTDTSDESFAATTSSTFKTEANGRFTASTALPPGKHVVQHHRPGPVQIAELDLRIERPIEDVVLVTHRPTPGEASVISGRVVDANARPLAGATLRPRLGSLSNQTCSCRSQRDGTFVLVSPGSVPPPSILEIQRAGYETHVTPAAIAWGSTDIEIVLDQAPGLVVRVTDPDDQPIERYSVRAFPRDRGGYDGEDFVVRARGPFENGTARVSRLASGKWTVMIEFPSASRLQTVFVPIEVTRGVAAHLDLQAECAVARTLRVLTATGEPVAGMRVQLCDLIDGSFDERTNLLTSAQMSDAGVTKRALICCDGTTDADGRLLLHGPGSRALALRLPGPGHVPLRQTGVWLTETEELEVRVQVGATLTGRIVPPQAMDELRRLQALGPDAPFPADTRPCIALHRPNGATQEWQRGAEASPFSIDDHGAFHLDGLQPGTWTLCLQRVIAMQGGIVMGGPVDITSVDLRDGTTTTIDLDLGALLPGTLEGTVLRNGAALADTVVTLQCRPRSGEGACESPNVRTDANGRFVHVGRSGEYDVRLLSHRQGRICIWTAAGTATVARDQTTQQTFAFWIGKLKVTLLDESGAPARDVVLLVDDDSGPLRPTVPTDTNGALEVELTAGTVTLRVLPQRLQSQAAQMQMRQATNANGDPLAAYYLTLGTVTIRADQPTAIELRLPAAWRQ
jgi:protocatechuate 3,4-dioxygenase beta subunit